MKQNFDNVMTPCCQFKQAEHFAFCGRCGLALLQSCPHCFQALPGHFSFCGYCGQPLIPRFQTSQAIPADERASLSSTLALKPETVLPVSPQAEEALAHSAVARVSERRQVTVLFADICGFTALSEKLDPEEVSNIIQPLFQACNAIIGKFEGVVEKFIGDAIMALFGVPRVHEDDPERAALAALEMRDQVQAFSQALEKERGFSLNMRIGLNQGMVVAGSVEALEGMNYQVMGDAINTAARMEQNAQPGHILVTEELYQLLNESFELKQDRLIQAKGKAEPLQAYELMGVRNLRQRSRGGIPQVWVGRKQETEAFFRLAQLKLEEKQLLMVHIEGESGLGKTSLAQHVAQLLKAENEALKIVSASSTSYSTNFPYFMLQSLLRSLFSFDENPGHAEVHLFLESYLRALQLPNAQMMSSVIEYILFPHLEFPQLKLMPPERLQKQIFRALGELLNKVSQSHPLFVLIDDLQWCDALSLAWLHQLHESINEQPFIGVLCVTQRSSQSKASESKHAQLPWQIYQTLPPLSAQESELLFAGHLGFTAAEQIPENLRELKRTLLERAGGNPLYIQEVLKNLLDDQLLVLDQGVWELKVSLHDLPFPTSIQRLILVRFDRLVTRQRHLLQTLSAMGGAVSLALLKNLQNEPVSQRDLDELVAAGWLLVEKACAEPEYRIHQALTQEVIYSTMVKRRRLVLHRKIGEYLEVLSADHPEPHLDLLAYHFSRSEESQKAIRYLYLSAERASRLCANHQALEQIKQILAGLDDLDDSVKIAIDLHKQTWLGLEALKYDLLEKKAEILFRTGDYSNLLNLLEREFQADLPALQKARLMFWHGRVQEKRSEFALAQQTLELALKILAPLAEAREQARFWNAIAWVCRWQEKYPEAMQACESALKLLDLQPDMEQIAYAYNVMGVVCYYRHEWEKALEYYRKGLAIQEQIQDLWGHANSLSNMGNVYFLTNHWEKAFEVFRQSLKIREQLGDLEGISTSCNNLGHASLEMGKLDQAEKYLLRAHQLFKHLKQAVGSAVSQCNLGLVAFHRKQWTHALSQLEPGILSLEQQKVWALLPELYNTRVEIYLEMENFEAAQTILEKQAEVIETHGDPVQKGRALRLTGHFLLKTDQTEKAREPLNQAVEILEPTGHLSECRLLYQDLIELHQSLGLAEISYWKKALQDLNLLDAKSASEKG
ncbi:hypothetical protein COW36_19595 [bacterium (Candidatus Blackallbacteria) CG17_big_fil_post_rev_8_21_14_2_50_48_46]|uniref:Guanylate cyclase domain-containing protein n=1 Tax=bacterium (Candidatus Blackallbacteria) CG17_big_fil_post_rev_8_21_14_2_50_48_46 TaxID=2014261 RepID=A0A2M7G0A2_9BACT|nr:MAG: hypothetical protein COW64_15700 [bacterium (Candidatus Blackallbacteria) CG18_big_fil_WC_8_21_14_2_50_49_26]PIW14857.1 MAG: hypothetical protein COW36_19595 [bacterium (Candidatus Blackallbacteria) CG17_big_fil_post_rev_8_21_14_2_50_48_46]PIW44424.1 MAG: hypothetical protein COW20_24170 [bacterium (Candidatus Blackallbacteria) CG13_big_fil_rev_8_21_14_2_50_49_14]